MTSSPWKQIDEVSASITASRVLPNGFFISLIRRMHAAIARSSTEQLRTIREGLDRVLKDTIANVAPEIVSAAGDSNLEHSLAASFILGQLSFAHQLVVAAEEKPDAKIHYELVNSPKFKPFILALLEENLCGQELANRCRIRNETVSRNLAELRQHGITDYRREGTSLVNFLTPAGRALAVQLPQEPKNDHRLAAAKLRVRKASLFSDVPVLVKKVQGL